MKSNLHTHTNLDDGTDTPEELVLAALEQGFDTLGFSGHSYAPHAESWCMSRENTAVYRSEVQRLQAKYAGRIRILCGIEQDCWSPDKPVGYDYVIGSVHALYKDGAYHAVDDSRQVVQAAVAKHWGGDYYAWCEDYYRLVSQVVSMTGADIIGHFDLVTKFNEGGVLFDETHPRYVQASQAAALALLKTGKVFEINTGAMARGYRTEPYPSKPLRAFLDAHGAVFVLTSDCHDRRKLAWGFDSIAL